jgi:hypothetical protein
MLTYRRTGRDDVNKTTGPIKQIEKLKVQLVFLRDVVNE